MKVIELGENKKYFWLKLYNDFFTSKRVKRLRSLAGGDTYTIIYLKMQLKALKDDGYLYFDDVMDDFAEELALDIDENADDVRVTIQYLSRVGLLESSENGKEYFLPYVQKCIGSETASTQRSRLSRANKAAAAKVEAKTNAERQNSFRAKKVCEENGHVPFIEDYANKKRYNGNYYICFKRDKCECAICGSKQNLCMHHIDGYDEAKPQNSEANKMITLCRECHSKVHAGQPIPNEILESIGYWDFSNESNEKCNTDATPMQLPATTCNTEIEKDKETEIEKEVEKKNNYQLVADMYNNTCVSFPRLTKLSDSRKKAIGARLKKYSLEEIQRVFDLAEKSDFLKGNNGRNWNANFDWLMNDTNMAKVLDGNYINKPRPQSQNNFSGVDDDFFRRRMGL